MIAAQAESWSPLGITPGRVDGVECAESNGKVAMRGIEYRSHIILVELSLTMLKIKLIYPHLSAIQII